MSAADLRSRLQRRLDDARIVQQRLEAGIASLDAGASPEEVMGGLFEPGMPRAFDQPWRGGMESRGPMTPEERERLLSLIRERMPRVAEWIVEMERDEPRLLEAVRARLAPQLREIDRLRERDPAGAQIRTNELIATIGVMRATRLYRGAVVRTGAESRAALLLNATLREALVAQFDAHLASSEHEIGALSARIEGLRADIASQTLGREAFIDAAMERITQDALEPARGHEPTGAAGGG